MSPVIRHRSYRIGPCMLAVTAYVAAHPGCPKIRPACRVSPRGENGIGLAYGYRSVDRALRAGLIEDRSGERYPAKGYQLYVTPKGTAELGKQS